MGSVLVVDACWLFGALHYHDSLGVMICGIVMAAAFATGIMASMMIHIANDTVRRVSPGISRDGQRPRRICGAFMLMRWPLHSIRRRLRSMSRFERHLRRADLHVHFPATGGHPAVVEPPEEER